MLDRIAHLLNWSHSHSSGHAKSLNRRLPNCLALQDPIRERGHRAGRERVPLHQFLRMIAGRAAIVDRANGSNDELVANLRRVGVLSS